MPQPIRFASTGEIQVPALVPVKEPLGLPVAAASSTKIETEDGLLAGVWVCTPGRWRRHVMSREFCHFIEGHGFFTPDGGETIELRAGDAALFPADCCGTWDVRETLRKSFVVIR